MLFTPRGVKNAGKLGLYGKGGTKSDYVEEFMKQINKKREDNVYLHNFIQKGLVMTLEFSDGDIIVFNRYYKEIEENLDLLSAAYFSNTKI